MEFKKVVAVMAGVLTPARIAAVLLIGAGLWGLMFGSFSFDSSHDALWRGTEMSFRDRMTVHVPLWASVGAIVTGALLMLVRRKTAR